MKKTKGFTLAELLIVVAIIAVLVAVSIPVLNNQVEKAREADDLANLRIALEEVSKASLDPSTAKSETSDPYSEVICNNNIYEIRVRVAQKKTGWQCYNAETTDFAGNKVGVPAIGDSAYWIVQLNGNDQNYIITKSS